MKFPADHFQSQLTWLGLGLFLPPRPPGLKGRVGPLVFFFALLLTLLSSVAKAESLQGFDLVRSDDGFYLDFTANFELSSSVEAALQKGVALSFVAEVQVFRERWYWRDQRVSRVSRAWRLYYQPLTRQYRVSFGGVNLSFDNIADALAVVQRVSQWKVAEAVDIAPTGQYYLQLTYQLDTSALPRPVQIGVGGQPEWALVIQKTHKLPPPAPAVAE